MLSLSFKSVHEKVWKKEAQRTVQVQVMIHNCGNNYGMYKSVAMGFKTSLQQTRHQLHRLIGYILNVSKHFSTLGHLLSCLWLLKSLFTLCAVFQQSHNKFHLSCMCLCATSQRFGHRNLFFITVIFHILSKILIKWGILNAFKHY